jgi:surface antigen
MAGVEKKSGLRAVARNFLFCFSVAGAALASVSAAQAHTIHHERHATLALRSRHTTHVEVASAHHEYGAVHYSHYRHHEVGYRPEYTDYAVHHRYATHYRHSYLQCVPYAREVSHIALSGNAFLWWAEAADRYARGSTPEEGAVLNFRAIGRMPLGHVAVVTSVINPRTILVTQANWVRGTITNDVTMQDVSPNNDWTQVQVELGDSSTWGAAYPTYGFIYNRPVGSSTIIAANAPAPATEVAEAPTAAPVSTDAPDRNLQ